MTEGYSLRDVGKLLGLSRSIISGLIDAGFVTPTRGTRGEFRFTFQDLVLLRAAQGLSQAKLPPSRIVRALKRLRAQLPEAMPLTGLRIEAVGDSVVVNQGSAQWQPEDGQYVMRFAVEVQRESTAVAAIGSARDEVEPPARLAFVDARDRAAPTWFERGLLLESEDLAAACEAYRNALRDDDKHVFAYINLGRCLHDQERFAEAEAVYREGLAKCGPDETLLFNLAIALEDLHRHEDAANTYRAALEQAPDMADAHYNLALLCEARGLRQEALRHWSAYRKLIA
ncbi:MAG TPA: tetratricopeptide repeat protein [Burkholderiales bacterium]|nr:tetratricopeptide repeat protein [Burkholderiales bacterium]